MRYYLNIMIIAVGLAFALNVSFVGTAKAQLDALGSAANFLGIENSTSMKTAMAGALEAGKVGKQRFKDKPGMKAFYQDRGYEVVWLRSSFLRQRKAESLVKVFENSWKHGLNPSTYKVEKIRSLMKASKSDDRFELELLLSDSLVRYGRDLTGMRVKPSSIGQRSKYWRTPLRGIDILDHVANAQNVKAGLKSLAPQGKLYKKLQVELARLYKTKLTDVSEKPIRFKGILRPGRGHKSILAVRERMGFKAENASQGAYYYDDSLAKAIMDFQKSHGLTPDGIIGAHTMKLMNMTRDDRLNQVLVNLERLRWVEPNKPERYIMVNVPSAMLWAVDGGKVKIEMPVVVGRKKRPTNIFTATVTGIRFNPTWTVPPTIKREDYLPKLQENPYYLSDRGIELMDGNMTIDPGQIDWAEKSWNEVNAMRMVQGSGRNNPLGLVRFIMSNPYNIYLHDTPKKSYFKRANRALSSGCVRLRDPQKLADFVLEPNDNWSKERRERIIKRGRLADVMAQSPLPVYILYQTVWMGDTGQIVYGPDLYGHDIKLLKRLKKMDAVIFPEEQDSIKTAQK